MPNREVNLTRKSQPRMGRGIAAKRWYVHRRFIAPLM
jgi:hypothetical protein